MMVFVHVQFILSNFILQAKALFLHQESCGNISASNVKLIKMYSRFSMNYQIVEIRHVSYLFQMSL